MMKELVFATNNAHKLSEVRRMVGDRFIIRSLDEIGCHDDIPETAGTLAGNAIIKARWVKEKYGYDCFADDTGLMVDALGGAPGIYTARFAGEHCTPDDNVTKLLEVMQDRTDRSARFSTVIALILNGKEQIMEGTVEGEISTERRGTDGFGYDPVFIPEHTGLTFAQMGPDAKNAISHRGRAIARLLEALTSTVKEVDNNLYLGYYSDTIEFGISNGKLKTGEELESLKNRASDRVEKRKQDEARKIAVEEAIAKIKALMDEDEIVEEADDARGGALRRFFERTFEDEESNEDDDDAFFADAREGGFENFFADEDIEEDDEDIDDDDKSSKPIRVRLNGLTENFEDNFDEDEDLEGDFVDLWIDNFEIVSELRLTYAETKAKAKELGIDISTITTKEQLEGFLNKIKCGK